jgi:predicted Zn-ribbon and HTH transcriptional regulator
LRSGVGDERTALYGSFYPATTTFEVTMKTTRKGLRDGELEKDTYGRLNCAECGETLKTKNDPDEVYTVRRCPDCETEWKELR